MQPNRSAIFGNYVLLRKLASGGMGEVFLACLRGAPDRLVVIKRILSQHLDKKDYLDMFFAEARLVARMDHPHIVRIREMGEYAGDHYIAMEYVRGKSLRDVVDELRAEGTVMPVAHVLDLGIKLCDGLGHAHQARDDRGRPMNIVHRDINPHNVLISYEGDLKLIDFGIAKSEMNAVHTATGTIKGKFVYMSPEQSAADPLDARSDLFSVGIVLYEMLALENPFIRPNVVLSLEAIQRHPVPAPSKRRLDAGPLDKVLLRALEKSPEERFRSAHEMRDALWAVARSGQVEPPKTSLSGFLHRLFAADIAQEETLLTESRRSVREHLVSGGYGDEEPTVAGDPDDLARLSLGVAASSQPSVVTLGEYDAVPEGGSDELAPTRPLRKKAAAARESSVLVVLSYAAVFVATTTAGFLVTRSLVGGRESPLSALAADGPRSTSTSQGPVAMPGLPEGDAAALDDLDALDERALAGALRPASSEPPSPERRRRRSRPRVAPSPAALVPSQAAPDPSPAAPASSRRSRKPGAVSPGDPVPLPATEAAPPSTPALPSPVRSAPATNGELPLGDEAPQRGEIRGYLGVTVTAPLAVVVDGQHLGRAPVEVALRREAGKLILSGGREVDWFITLDYVLRGPGPSFRLDASPRSVVEYAGRRLGRTPLAATRAARRHRFLLRRPGRASPVVITLEWNPQ